jgi:L-fuculokinase
MPTRPSTRSAGADGRQPAAAVLDVGRTNVRLCAIDERGNALRILARPNAVIDGPPYPHFDTDGLFDWTIAALGGWSRDLEVHTLIPVTHGAAAALVGARGLRLPILDYEFEGVGEIDAEYDALARDFRRTASPKLPAGLNLGRQLFWQQRRYPEEFNSAAIIPYPQYWAWRMTGVAAWEPTSLGCHTDLWEPETRDFSALARTTGWSARFPRRVTAWTALGAPHRDIGAQARLPERCTVLAGIHDSNASWLAHRATRDDQFAVVSTGTWIIAMAQAGSPGSSIDLLREERDTLANVDAFGSPVATARFMGGREYAAIAGEDGLRAEPAIADLTALLARGTLAIPAFADRGGPFRAHLGQVIGAQPAGPVARAALAAMYCALMTDLCLDFIDARGDLIIEGRMAPNQAYVAALAALRSRQRVLVSPDETGTLRGAAILLALARGRHPRPGALAPCPARAIAGLDDARQRWRKLLP